MKEILDYIDTEMSVLDKGLVATPANRKNLESFAKANQGSMDILLMQMAVQYGYKIALENLLEAINSK